MKNEKIKEVGHLGSKFMATELGLQGKPKEAFEKVSNRAVDSHIDKSVKLMETASPVGKIEKSQLENKVNATEKTFPKSPLNESLKKQIVSQKEKSVEHGLER